MALRITWSLALTSLVACAALDNESHTETEQDSTVCSDHGAVVYGVDVSGYQRTNINWGDVREAGKVFAFAKASEGTGFIDASFSHNWHGAQAAGLLRGAYHFFHPGVDGIAQANFFVDEIVGEGGLANGDLPPVADVELSDGESPSVVISRLRDFLDQVQSRTGRVPMIYTANFFWGDYLGNPDFSSNPLWVANYGPSCPDLPSAFSHWQFWQYSDDVGVSGIPSGVDGDMFNGSLAELKAFAGAGGEGGVAGGFRTSRRVTQNADGRLEMFARAPDKAIFHDWQTSANGRWDGWVSLEGAVVQNPVVASDADGRLEVFVIAGGHLYERFELIGGGWYDLWLDQGGTDLVGEPAALLNADGRLEAFARDGSGALWHKWQVAANGSWNGWAKLGGVITSNPNVGRNKDGRLEVFALGDNAELFHIWQVNPGGSWSGWAGFGGIQLKGTPHVGNNADGRLEVFVTGSDNRLHHIAQIPEGGWSGWINAGTFDVVGEPAMARNADGRMEVFARGSNNALWHLWQTARNSGWTSGRAIVGTSLASDPDVAPNADGRLEAFWRATDGSVRTAFQTSPGGGWSAEYSFGGVVSDF